MSFLRDKLKSAGVGSGVMGGASAAMGVSSFGAGHSAARYSSKRGYVYYPHVEAPRAIDEWTRGELMRKSAWAYDEVGWVGGLTDNSAKWCAKMSQKAATGDVEWNLLADAAFESATGSLEGFDLAGKYDWRGLVKALFHTRFRLGDCGVILTESAEGSPMVKFVEGCSIGDNPEALDDELWTDGLLLDAHGKALRYRVLDGAGGHTDYDRADFVFFCKYDKSSQRRGLPKTFRMLNKVQDAEEIQSFWSAGIKASSQVGMQIVNAKTENSGGPVLMGGSKGGGFKARSQEDISRADMDGSSKVLEMGDERVELLHDKRPAPDQVAYLDYQKRDCAAGWGLPVETVWKWGNAGGAISRTLLLEVQDFIDDEQELFLRQCGVRLRNWVISKLVEGGFLRRCEDSAWWVHSWMYGARKTADFAKDGRIYLEALNRGELSPDRYHAMQNQDVDAEDVVTINRWEKRRAMCNAKGLDVNFVFPPAPGTPVSPDVVDVVEDVNGVLEDE